jgi:hypothetical protein
MSDWGKSFCERDFKQGYFPTTDYRLPTTDYRLQANCLSAAIPFQVEFIKIVLHVGVPVFGHCFSGRGIHFVF